MILKPRIIIGTYIRHVELTNVRNMSRKITDHELIRLHLWSSQRVSRISYTKDLNEIPKEVLVNLLKTRLTEKVRNEVEKNGSCCCFSWLDELSRLRDELGPRDTDDIRQRGSAERPVFEPSLGESALRWSAPNTPFLVANHLRI